VGDLVVFNVFLRLFRRVSNMCGFWGDEWSMSLVWEQMLNVLYCHTSSAIAILC